MDTDCGDLNHHDINNKSAKSLTPSTSTPFHSFPQTTFQLSTVTAAANFPPPHLSNLREMLDTTSALENSHHHHHLQQHFDNRGAPMYYPSQPSSSYEEGSPDSLRKSSPVNFLRSGSAGVQTPKNLLDLEPRAMQSLDSAGRFDTRKSDYYGGGVSVTETYAAAVGAPFLRSTASEYYPMESNFATPPSQAPQIHSPPFMKVEEPPVDPLQGGSTTTAASAYQDYTSVQMRHQSSLILPNYGALEDNYGKVPTLQQTQAASLIQQHPLPQMSTPPASGNTPTNVGPISNTNSKSSLPTPNTSSTAIIYPWMKRVHSRGKHLQ